MLQDRCEGHVHPIFQTDNNRAAAAFLSKALKNNISQPCVMYAWAFRYLYYWIMHRPLYIYRLLEGNIRKNKSKFLLLFFFHPSLGIFLGPPPCFPCTTSANAIWIYRPNFAQFLDTDGCRSVRRNLVLKVRLQMQLWYGESADEILIMPRTQYARVLGSSPWLRTASLIKWQELYLYPDCTNPISKITMGQWSAAAHCIITYSISALTTLYNILNSIVIWGILLGTVFPQDSLRV